MIKNYVILDPTIRVFPEDRWLGILAKVLRSLKILTALMEYFVFGLNLFVRRLMSDLSASAEYNNLPPRKTFNFI